MDELSREPTVAEIAKELSISEEDIVFALDAIQDPISLYEPIYHDDGDAIFVMDQIGDSKVNDALWLDSIAITQGLHHLADREQRILQMRFFEGKTQMEVSREIGISQAQVSRLEKNALKHMQKYV
jgi:RNA polymerase sporulation-specific sigma factor